MSEQQHRVKQQATARLGVVEENMKLGARPVAGRGATPRLLRSRRQVPAKVEAQARGRAAGRGRDGPGAARGARAVRQLRERAVLAGAQQRDLARGRAAYPQRG
jgi:hypothetical protein